MLDLARHAVEVAKSAGATYADARAILAESEGIQTKNGRLAELERAESAGVGVRVYVDGAMGFAATSDPTKAEVERTANHAVDIARASGLVPGPGGPVKLAEQPPHVARYETPYVVDPFAIPVEEKVAHLLAVDAAIRKASKAVKVAQAFASFRRKRQFYASSDGAAIEQVIRWAGAGCTATAVSGEDAQTRSHPAPFGGNWATAGYEWLAAQQLLAHAARVAEEAERLLAAPQCPQGDMDLIVGPNQLALQLHESCGHPIELDRVLGTEANYAGTSFLTTDKLGKFRYGSPVVNIAADANTPLGLGTFGYDDEGVPAQRWDIVKEGQFVGYLTSRETAPVVSLARSQGAMRADGYNRIPLIRMTNVSLAPGTGGTLEELIADTKSGILVDTNRSWSIDQRRYNFQFVCEVGREIKDGKLGRLFKNPSYQGITPEFWGSCDRVGGVSEWRLFGVPNCGKGEPGQSMGTGHGAAPARFRKVKVGAAYNG